METVLRVCGVLFLVSVLFVAALMATVTVRMYLEDRARRRDMIARLHWEAEMERAMFGGPNADRP